MRLIADLGIGVLAHVLNYAIEQFALSVRELIHVGANTLGMEPYRVLNVIHNQPAFDLDRAATK